MDVLNYNDYQEEDSSFLLDALKVGVAAELMYIDNDAKVRFRTIDPLSCFGVYDNTLSGDLRYFVRIYQANEWDNSINYCVDVYDDKNVTHYNMAGKNGQLTPLSQSRHYFSQVPANIFYLPDEKSVFDAVMGLQDAANTILSDEVDDYSAFCDAYFALIGIDPTDENIEQIALMKQNRTLVLPEGSTATWLTKNATDTQVENILKRIKKSDVDITTNISEDGMRVSKGSEVVLTANNGGVEARNLHATTYLIIGENSRFEDYDNGSRTGCFWIGG